LDREEQERLGRLSPETKVNSAIGMSDVCVRICADGVRDQDPGISEEELVEKVREGLLFDRHSRGVGV
jgi:hypothetical protein